MLSHGGPIRPMKNGGPIRPMLKNGGPIRPRSIEHLTFFTFFNISIIPYTSIKKWTTVLNKEIKNKTFLKSKKRQTSPIMCYPIELCSAIYFVIFLTYFLFFVFQKR